MTEGPLSLFQLNTSIKEVLANGFLKQLWVTGEISEININKSGHCYLELIEKGEDDTIIARSRATIWAYTFRMLKPYFETSTGQILTQGLKILVSVGIEFHEVYGLSLNIKDIDPSYTIGDIERQRQQTIKKLEEEGVITMNREIILPEVIQKIAIISSETAAGYEDFMNQLNNNEYGYKFYAKLFQTYMQGNEAVDSIINALDIIFRYESIFDVVVIIRGGGAHADLNCFDNYWLAYHITQFSLPVLTGIGHEKDDSVVDIVANTRLKTPTAVAEFIINCNSSFEMGLFELESRLISKSQEIVTEHSYIIDNFHKSIINKASMRLAQEHNLVNLRKEKIKNSCKSFLVNKQTGIFNYISNLDYLARQLTVNKDYTIQTLSARLKHSIKNYLKNHEFNLENYTRALSHLNPINILERGYSLTYKDGKIISDAKKLKRNDRITTLMKNGKLDSIVDEIIN